MAGAEGVRGADRVTATKGGMKACEYDWEHDWQHSDLVLDMAPHGIHHRYCIICNRVESMGPCDPMVWEFDAEDTATRRKVFGVPAPSIRK